MSNKSLDYLLERKQDKDLADNAWLKLADLKEPLTLNFFEIVSKLYEIPHKFDKLDITKNWEIDGNTYETKIEIRPCKRGNFDYYTSNGNYNDGTFVFMEELVGEVVYSVVGANTFYNKIYSLDDITEKVKSGKYYFVYEVGDIIVTGEQVDSPDKDKPWLSYMSCAFLPLRMKLEKYYEPEQDYDFDDKVIKMFKED